MKLGVTGMMPEHLEQVDQNLARKIARQLRVITDKNTDKKPEAAS